MRSLAKELALSLPNALKVNRGKMSIREVLFHAKTLGAQRVIIVGRGLRGNPGRIEIFERMEPPLVSMIVKLCGVKLARELGVRPQPPRRLSVVVQPSSEAWEFAHELAIALNLPLIEEVEPRDLSHVYDSALLVEQVGRTRALLALRFVDAVSGHPRGPRLLVEKYRVMSHANV